MKKVHFPKITGLSCICLCLLLTNCSKNENVNEEIAQETKNGILRITSQELFNLLDDPTNYENYLSIERKYAGTYKPKAELPAPQTVHLVTRSGIQTRSEINSEAGLQFLFNENNALQCDNYVYVINEDSNILQVVEKDNYNYYLHTGTSSVTVIPENDLSYSLTFYNDDDEEITPSRIGWGWCIGCGLGGVATIVSGGTFGVLDVFFCAKCVVSFRKTELAIYEENVTILKDDNQHVIIIDGEPVVRTDMKLKEKIIYELSTEATDLQNE